MKNGKEIKLNLSEDYNIVSGTVDNNTTKSVYISISTWGQPKIKEDNINYKKIINNIHRAVQYNISSSVNPELFTKNKIIVDLDMRKSGVGYGKRSFMNCEINLYQINKHKINSEEVQGEVKRLSGSIIDMLNNNQYFTFHKRKK